MKQDWKKIIEQDVSEEARNRTFAAADRLLDGMQPERKSSWLEMILSPAGAMTFAGAAAAITIFVMVSNPTSKQPSVKVASLEPELIQNIDLLLELETLEHWKPDATDGAKKKWKKKRS